MELSEILGQYMPVLDHGFVSLQGVFGGDEDIEQFARVSYQKGTRQKSDTRGLIRYLMAHEHSSPLEAVEFKFHVRMPIFVARQWIRHRTASLNEQSARYSVIEDRYYVPELAQIQQQSKTNKQGREEWDIIQGPQVQKDTQSAISNNAIGSFIAYDNMILDDVARETARMVLPLNTYTEMYWKMDLKNLFHFLSLRCDSHAQWEIREYANVIARMVEVACPLAYEAWIDYQYEAVTFSRMEMQMLRKMLEVADCNTIMADPDGTAFDIFDGERFGVSTREWNEFEKKLSVVRTSFPALDPIRFRSPELQELYDKEN
jgi:thymidylate synthase (FAD)